MNSPQTTSLSKQLDQRLSALDSTINTPHATSSYRGPLRPGLLISLPTDNSSSRHSQGNSDLRTNLGQHKRKRTNQYSCFQPKNNLDSSPQSSSASSFSTHNRPHRPPSPPSFHQNNHHHNHNYSHRPSTRSQQFHITTPTSTVEKRKREQLRFDDDNETKDEIQCFDDNPTPQAQPKHTPLRNSRTVGSPEKIIVTSEDDTEEGNREFRSKTKQSDYEPFRLPNARASDRPNRNGHLNDNSRNADITDLTQEEKIRNVRDRLGKKEARPSADTIYGNTARRHPLNQTYAEHKSSHLTTHDTASQLSGARPKTAHGRTLHSDVEGKCEFDTMRPTKVIDRMQRKVSTRFLGGFHKRRCPIWLAYFYLTFRRMFPQNGDRSRRLIEPSRKNIHIEDITEFSDIIGSDNPRLTKQNMTLRRKTDESANSQSGMRISIPMSDENSDSHPSAHLNGENSSCRRMSEGRDFGQFPTLEIKKIFYDRTLNDESNTDGMKLVFTPSAAFKIVQRNTDLVKIEGSQVHAFNWYDIPKVTFEPLIVISAASRDRRENDRGNKDSQKTKYYMVPASTGTEMTKFLKAVREKYESSNRKIPFSVLTDEQVADLPGINQITNLKEITPRRATYGRHALARDTHSSGSGMVTRSKRRSIGPQHDLDVALFSYPFGERGSVSITKSDLGRLNDNEFLNDNLIEWFLKYIQNTLQEKNPELASTVHFFNSFFYKRLTEKETKGIAYGSVKKWTNKVDLFDKQYIFIPINENLHWYLALIYNPGFLLKPLESDYQKENSPQIIASESEGSNTGTPKNTTSSDVVNPSISNGEVSLETEGEGAVDTTFWIDPSLEGNLEVKSIASDNTDLPKDEEGFTEPAVIVGGASGKDIDVVDLELEKQEVAELIVDEATRDSEPPAVERLSKGKSKGSKERTRPSDMTYIVIFDSLNNKNNKILRRNLLEYLTAEALEKKNKDITEVTKERLRLTNAKVPGQSNFCDCGVYLLHYVETFLSDPQTLLDIIVNREEDKKAWLYTTVKKRREKMRELADKLADEYEEWQTEKATKLSLQDT